MTWKRGRDRCVHERIRITILKNFTLPYFAIKYNLKFSYLIKNLIFNFLVNAQFYFFLHVRY
jgi:hypothetical protein